MQMNTEHIPLIPSLFSSVSLSEITLSRHRRPRKALPTKTQWKRIYVAAVSRHRGHITGWSQISRKVIRDLLCTSFAADADAFASHRASLVSFAIKA